MAFSYDQGLKALEPHVPKEDPTTWNEFQAFRGQLLENLRSERLFGSTPQLQNTRNIIVYNLNELTLRLINMSFNDLCESKPVPNPPSGTNSSSSRSNGGGGVGYMVNDGSTPKAVSISGKDAEILEGLLARLAARSAVNVRQYFRDRVNRTDMPDAWKQEIADVWKGDARSDARTLIEFTVSKGTIPDKKRFTALGNFLYVLLRDDVGFEDSTTIAALIVANRLYNDKSMLDKLAMRYQIPQANDLDIGSVEYGPDIEWHGPSDDIELQSFFREPPDFQDVAFLRRGIEHAISICKIEIPLLQRPATGFLVASDLVLTNYHVLKLTPGEDIDANARNAILRFGYFTALGDNEAEGRTFKLVDNKPIVMCSPVDEFDYVLLRVDESIKDARDIAPLQEFNTTPPTQRTGLHILQHPHGMTLKLATSVDGVTGIYPDRNLIQYITRTLGGSSGSPCFDDDWKLVALHHAQRTRPFGSVREGILIGPIVEQIKPYL